MRTIVLSVLLAFPIALATSCDDPSDIAAPDETLTTHDALFSAGPGPGPANELQNFVAPHSGDQEVPANDSKARGQAVFQLSKDGTEIHFRLIVANLENITQAHIHCGPAGENGPIIAWLYPFDVQDIVLIPGRTSGILDQGVITEDDVVVQPDSRECPGGVANLDDLIEKLRTDGAYSNIHTEQFPPGEIRGQIRAGGPHH